MSSEFLRSFDYVARGLYFVIHEPNAVIEMIKEQLGLLNDVDVRLRQVTKSSLKITEKEIPDKEGSEPKLGAKIFSDKT